MKVARHGFNPGIGDTDQRLAEIAVRETNRLEHGASSSPVAPVRNATTAMFEIHGRKIMTEEEAKKGVGFILVSVKQGRKSR